MKPITALHTADFHYYRENKEKALLSLETVCKTGEEKAVDLFILSGDLFDRPVNDTESSGFPSLLNVMERMMNIAPVVAVTGTPTHDLPGCYEVFQKIKAKHRFTILKPSIPYFLASDEGRSIVSAEPWSEDDRLLILGCPEPSKTWFTRDKQLGKAESDEAINEGMRQLLLGLGAIRKEYATIPCIFVGHIEVANTPTCTGHIIQGGIKIGKDDLALVGADYYALGHIHLGQEVRERAYYCGSAFPIDWGETDQKHFNLVKLEDDSFYLRVINYPHPIRKKIVLDSWPDTEIVDSMVRGFQCRVQLRMSKEERSSINTDSVLNWLMESGAAPGSIVEVLVKPTETIRSEQITDTTSLLEKVKIYAELSNDSVSDSILEKADYVEGAARAEGLTSERLHIRIKKLVLRGAIGVRKGIGKDQVEIDLDRFDPGLIALIGANGTGKTTLIENMHPFSQMLTRTGKLQDHFMLRDSIRDLYFVDEKTGTEYRAFMQIDGANVSGGVEYFLYRKENGQFVPLNSSINGRKDPYDSEIRNLFGNLDLYLRSTFYAQKQPKNHPELQDAAPTQRKEVFRNLGGLDYLQTYADYANAEQKSLNEKLIGENASINTLEQLVEDLPGQREVLNNRRCALKVKEEYLKEIECEKNRLENELKEISQRVEQNKRLHHELDTLYEQNQELSAEKAGLGKTIEQYQGALESRTEFAEKLQTIEDLKKQKADLENEKAEIYKQREQIQDKYSDRKNAVAAAEREINAKKAEANKRLYEANIECGTVKTQAEQLDKELREPVTENCPTCGQKWPPEKRTEFEQERAGKKLECEELQRKIFEIDKDISACHKELLKLEDELSKLEEPEAPFMPQFDDARLDAMLVELKNLNESFVRKKLDEAREAGVRIEESEKRLRLLEEQLSEKMKKANDLQDQVDDECEDKYEEVNEAVELARKNYAETDKEIARIQAEIDTTEKIIESLKEKDKELESLKESIKGHEKDLREWQYLQKACGPNGIQALELDAMGPSIAEVANSILESAYGSRFQIEFRTTRIGGSGSKTKQIEDFLIIVHDSLDGSEQPFEWMSGGESVWIKRSIYDAFGIIRARKTGTKFLTIFQDESDGALDPEARINYFKMFQKSHDESGRYHTIIISHSIECQEMVGQRILMEDLSEKDIVDAGILSAG